MKKHITHLTAAACLVFVASTAAAECTAVYKAKQDNPLRLEQSEMTVSGPCTKSEAKPKIEVALAARGWTLLKVLSVSRN